MTEKNTAPELNAREFYDALARDYDTMTGFDQRFVREKPFFRVLVDKHNIRSAVDAGCGTGFHSLLLAQLGVTVTAVDMSKEMLSQVRRHAERMHLQVRVAQGDFQTLAQSVGETADALFCLGNSLVHLLTDEDLRKAIQSFADALKPGGTLVLQNLNYDRILKDRERIQSVKEENGKTFVRFYEYGENDIVFTILTIDRPNGTPVQSHRSVRLRPILRDDLLSVLSEAGFTDAKTYRSIALDPFEPGSSRDLVVIAKKPSIPEQ